MPSVDLKITAIQHSKCIRITDHYAEQEGELYKYRYVEKNNTETFKVLARSNRGLVDIDKTCPPADFNCVSTLDWKEHATNYVVTSEAAPEEVDDYPLDCKWNDKDEGLAQKHGETAKEDGQPAKVEALE